MPERPYPDCDLPDIGCPCRRPGYEQPEDSRPCDCDCHIQVTIHGKYGKGPMPVEFRDAMVEMVRLVKRGADDLDNLQIAHYYCNILKSNGLSWQDRHPRTEIACVECGQSFIGLRGVSRYCTPSHQNAAAAQRFRDRKRSPAASDEPWEHP
jgi:hypothetical protein